MRAIQLGTYRKKTFAPVLDGLWYVQQSGGNDGNPGSSGSPFASISATNAVVGPGDVVIIRSGIYRESPRPGVSGTAGNEIIYIAELGADVTVSGMETANGGWSVHAGDIYEKSITLPVANYNINRTNNTTILANQILKDSIMLHEAGWPKRSSQDDLLNRGTFRKLGMSGFTALNQSSLNDSAIPAIAGGWVGGKISGQGWYESWAGDITSEGAGTIGFNGGRSGSQYRKYYRLSGKLGALTQAGEWYYDGVTHVLYVWQPGGGTPTGIEYKARNWAFDLTSRSYINITRLKFIGCDPVEGNTSTNNCTIDSIDAKYLNHTFAQPNHFYNLRQTGIRLLGSDNVVKNSKLQYAASQATMFGHRGRLENCRVQDIDYEGNYGSAVGLWGQSAGELTVVRNTMKRFGRSAINIGNDVGGVHHDIIVEMNDISRFGMLNFDVGGFYSWGQQDCAGGIIRKNWIYNSDADITSDGIQTCIYFDQLSGPWLVHHNFFGGGVYADAYNQPGDPFHVPPLVGPPSYWYNNTFTTNPTSAYVVYVNDPKDVMRNNIYLGGLNFNNGGNLGNSANSINQGTNPQFVATGVGGLYYRIGPTSPARNAGIVIPGITDGYIGVAPDCGCYEYGGDEWVPGCNLAA